MSEEEKKKQEELSDETVETVSGGFCTPVQRPEPFTPPPERDVKVPTIFE